MSAAFAFSYAALCVIQGLTVAAPDPPSWLRLPRLASRWWALVPVAGLAGTIGAIALASDTADVLTYLALVAVPPLAAFALGWVTRGARAWRALVAVPLFAIAWWDHGTLVGDVATVALTACSCVALASAVADNAPRRWVELGILVTAAVDTVLVSAQLLQGPDRILDAARPGGGLPQLQHAELGDALMGYGDLFVAALLGAMLATERARQVRAAVLTTGLAIAFGALFLLVNTLPATVPVAAAMVASARTRRRRAVAAAAAPGPQLGGARRVEGQ